jgi:hypothetical protein
MCVCVCVLTTDFEGSKRMKVHETSGNKKWKCYRYVVIIY